MRLPGIIPRNGSERFGRDAEMDEAVDRLVTNESATIQPQSAKGAKIKTTGKCMGDQKDKAFDVYDAFLGVLQLAMIVVFFFLIRSTTLPQLVKILFASGLSAIFLTRWTTKRSRPWWIFAVAGTVLAVSSLVVLALHS